MAGIRVITYTDADARKVSKIIKRAFEIRPEYSIDKSEELGIDRVGYRGIHYIANLGKDRLGLPENRLFKEYVFEIQVRSILQHAWAEFEHDRNYKFAGVLPKDLGRRLSLIAANLETIDREFDRLSRDIDKYAMGVLKKAKFGDLYIPINSTSLRTYTDRRFKSLIEKGVEPYGPYADVVIKELSLMGIETLDKLENIIPEDYIEKRLRVRARWFDESFVGEIRNILLIHDAERYFAKAWRGAWHGLDRDTIELAMSYGVDLWKYVEQYQLDVIP